MSAGPRFAVAGYLCFDLGGSVRDERLLIGALEKAGWTARRWKAGEGALQLSYKVSHVPTVLVEKRTVELELPPPARPAAVRTIKVFPSGVLSFGYLVECDPCSTRDLYAVKQCFSVSNKGGIASYLRNAYPERRSEIRERDKDFGIRVIDDLLAIRKAAQQEDVLAFRPGIHFPVLARYALCVLPRPGEGALDVQLRALGRAKQVGPPRVSSLPTATLASWEGFETYVATDGVKDLQRTLHAFELTHQFSFLCRAWTEILDRYATLDEQAGGSLEQRLPELAYYEHQITESMIEIDSGDVMLLDPVQLQLALEFRDRFFLERAKQIVIDRLGVLDRRTAVIGAAIDRNQQNRHNRDAVTLQLLFGAAVAASVAALVPPTVDPGLETTWRVVTWTALVLGWLVLLAVAIWMLRRRLRIPEFRPPTAPEWLERQPRPGSPEPPGRTPPERPDTGRDRPPG